MSKVIYLTHRVPYPPNKGDKVRSFHLMKALARQHEVYLGTFVDAPEDRVHVEALRQWCADVLAVEIDPLATRVRSLGALLGQEPLTLRYYRSRTLGEWVASTAEKHGIHDVIAFSAAMAQYARFCPGARLWLDLVDVDSAKWSEYGKRHAWPLSWLYQRESRTLLKYEMAAVEQSARAFLVTEAEHALFRQLAPRCAEKVSVVSNGVDTQFFSPTHDLASPYRGQQQAIVMTGAMDYMPNADGAIWFATSVMPKLLATNPAAHFYVVGMRPGRAVQDVAGDHVTVTGDVPDVRPYLRHAALAVAPLRIARGVQNKVLEGMAMARPMVVSSQCAMAIGANVGQELEVASNAEEFAIKSATLLGDRSIAQRMGEAARRRVLATHCWDVNLSRLTDYISDDDMRREVPGAPAGAVASLEQA